MKTEYLPLPQSKRIEVIDVIRGFAIFGILMVNIHLFYKPLLSVIMQTDRDISVFNSILESLTRFCFEGKFYVIFSFLFGFGFWIFMSKNNESSKSIVPVYCRRLFFLLIFGIAHVVLLWAGDILVFYALFGFILLLFRKSSNKKIFKWAIVFALIPVVLNAISVFFIWTGNQVPEGREAIAESMQKSIGELQNLYERAMAIYSSSSFSEIVSIRLSEYQVIFPALLFVYPIIMSAFLIGTLFARKNLLKNYTENAVFFKRAFWWGLGIGIPSNLLYVISYKNVNFQLPDSWMLINSSMQFIGGMSLGLCYVSTIVILFNKGKSTTLTYIFAPVGRMALTNYLSHSIICAILFYSFGFGLYGNIQIWQGILIAIIIFIAQIFFSRWWLKIFLFGPFEWLWRSLTYLKWQPIKKIND